MSRGVAPLLGVILFVGITVVLAAGVGAASFALVPSNQPNVPFSTETEMSSESHAVTISVNATAELNRIAIVHESGPDLNLSRDVLRIAVDGDELPQQPPGQFFNTVGFGNGPTGPINSGANPTWTAGEQTAFELREPNPALKTGSSVTVTILRNGTTLALETVTAD